MSVPVAVRRRWRTSRVTIEDEGDHIVIRPLPDDPIAALRGLAAGRGPTSDEARDQFRLEEREREEARYGRS